MSKSSRIIEASVGLLLLFVVVAFVLYFMISISKKSYSSYTINAIFSEAGGIEPGAPVTIKGVTIGKVSSVEITKDYNILLKLNIHKDIQIPVDSIASVVDTSLFSGRRVEISPGVEKSYLARGASVQHTVNYRYLEDKISSLFLN